MNLYRLKDGTFVGTQADAKSSGQEWEPFDFPTNPKSDTIEALNKLVGETQAQEAPQPAEPETPIESEVTDDATYAERIITQNLDGKTNVESAVNFIMKAHVITLGRLASAVSLRYNELSKRKRK